jgi:hypothetical protein
MHGTSDRFTVTRSTSPLTRLHASSSSARVFAAIRLCCGPRYSSPGVVAIGRLELGRPPPIDPSHTGVWRRESVIAKKARPLTFLTKDSAEKRGT